MGIRKSELVTGLFIIAALATLTYVGMGPLLKEAQGNKVEVHAFFDNVALLKEKAQVAVNGIQIGTVKSRERVIINDAIRVRVVMEIEQDFIDQCRFGTSAKVSQESLLGDKFIDFLPKLQGAPLEKKDGAYQLVGEDFSDWMTMLSGLGAKLDEMKLDVLAANINDLVVKVKDEMFSKRNLDNIALLLTNTNNLVAETEDMVKKLNNSLNAPEGIMAQAQATLENTADITGQLRVDYPEIKTQLLSTMGKADELLDSGNKRVNRVGEIIEESNPKLQSILDTAQNDLPKLFGKLDETLRNADTALNGADQLVRNQDLKRSMYNLSVVLQEMTLTLRSFRADMSQVLFGGPGEAQPAVPDPKNKIKDRTEGKPSPYGY